MNEKKTISLNWKLNSLSLIVFLTWMPICNNVIHIDHKCKKDPFFALHSLEQEIEYKVRTKMISNYVISNECIEHLDAFLTSSWEL